MKVHRFFSIPPAKLAERIEGLGDGLYIIGLNVHLVFVVVRDGEARFVHSSYTGDRVVTDEPLAKAKAIANSQSQGYFVSELLRPMPPFASGSRVGRINCLRHKNAPGR